MKRTFFIITFFIVAVSIFAREVPSTNQGIANASPGDHIVRSNGEKVFLRQSDIDYAKQQLGTSAARNRTLPSIKLKVSSSVVYNIVYLLVVIGIISVTSICFSNITVAIARNARMDDRSARKLGRNVAVLVCLAVTIAIGAMLLKTAGIKLDPKFLAILKKF